MNGYGLGNSTRIHAVIQQIGGECEMDVFAYGNSLKYFKQVAGGEVSNVFEGLPLEYGVKNREIDFFLTAGKIRSNLRSILKSRRQIQSILKSRSYCLMVSDSNFSPVLLPGRPKIISVNNSDVIVKRAEKLKDKKGYRAQYFTERADYLYQLICPDLVVSPFFEPVMDTKKFRHTGPIVRKEFRRAPHPFGGRHHVLIMTGGADQLNQGLVINHRRSDYDLSVLGESVQVSEKAHKEPKTFNASCLMNRATIVVIGGGFSSVSEALALAKPMIVVIGGGFSSVSEALALAKPMIVIPVKGHIEQRINALWIQEKGFGVVSSYEKLDSAITHIQKNWRHFEERLLNYKRLDGAKQAASLILNEMNLS